MFGWLSRASRRASRLNRSANAASAASDWGSSFSATRRSSRAGAPYKPPPCRRGRRVENFELREGGGHRLDGRRAALVGGLAGFGWSGDGGQEAFRAKAPRGVGRQRRLAFRTAIGNWFCIHTASFLRKRLTEVTQNRRLLAIVKNRRRITSRPSSPKGRGRLRPRDVLLKPAFGGAEAVPAPCDRFRRLANVNNF